MDKISIITVTYNCVDLIEETILSVLKQDYPFTEFIIIDGASSDGTVDIIQKYRESIAVFVSEPDKGIYDAMNKGLTKSTGDWVFFLNAGDVFYGNSTLTDILKNSTDNSTAYYGDIYYKKQEGLKLSKGNRPFWAPDHKYLSMGFSHQGVIVRSSLAKEFKFDLSYKCCADFKMIYSIYKKYGNFKYIDMPFSIVEGRTGFSANNRSIQRHEEAQILGIDKTLGFIFYDKYVKLKRVVKKIIKRK